MNIVWLTPEIPYPAIGGRNGVYNRIVQLGKRHNIFLFSIIYPDDDKQLGYDEMNQHCKEVHFYNRGQYKIKSMIRCLCEPHCVATRVNKQIKTDIEKCCDNNNIDIIIMDFPHMFKDVINTIKKRNIPLTIQQHNIEFLTMRSLSQVKSMSWLKKPIYYLESKRLEWYEKHIYKSNLIKSFSFFSESDKSFFEKNLKVTQKCSVIPLGANLVSTNVSSFYNQKKNILFVGKMSAVPNIDAAIWFAKKVFPLIKSKVEDAELYIIGANPSDNVLSLENDSIHVPGGYEQPDEYYENSMLVVVPVFNGGGVKGKLLEAIAFKRPVVATEHGIGGTKFEKDLHVKVSDNIEIFAEYCIDILNNPQNYTEMVDKANKLFGECYTWKSIGESYERFLQETIRIS